MQVNPDYPPEVQARLMKQELDAQKLFANRILAMGEEVTQAVEAHTDRALYINRAPAGHIDVLA